MMLEFSFGSLTNFLRLKFDISEKLFHRTCHKLYAPKNYTVGANKKEHL